MLSVEATYEIVETCLRPPHVQRAGRVVARHVDHVIRPLGLTNDTGRAVLAGAIELGVPADDRASRGLSGSRVRALCLVVRRLTTTYPSVRVSSAI